MGLASPANCPQHHLRASPTPCCQLHPWLRAQCGNPRLATPYALLADADLMYPRFLLSDTRSSSPDHVTRFYVGRLTPGATQSIVAGTPWETLFADYQGRYNRIFRLLYGAHNPCIYPTAVLHALHGYDERMVGWGREDDDLSQRTRRLGIRDVRIPLMVACLDDGYINDYPFYTRRRHSAQNNALWQSERTTVANPEGWGDEPCRAAPAAVISLDSCKKAVFEDPRE